MATTESPPSSRRRRAALEQYRRRARIYDVELAMFEPLRRAAIARLDLRLGQRVIDVGCGTGLSLTLLRRDVGATGHITGIEQCPPMIERARAVVEHHGWRNVSLIQSSIEGAALRRDADAALFHFTHDILREPRALHAIEQGLRPGARVVACGLRWANPWAWPVNLFVLGAALHSVTSLDGLDAPWSLLSGYLDDLRLETRAAGAVFIASGVLRQPRRRTSATTATKGHA